MEQGTKAWKAEKIGVLTSSRAASLMGGKSAKETLMCNMLCEVATAKEKKNVQTQAMREGIEREASARKYYSQKNHVEVVQIAFVPSLFHPRIGASPDGLVGLEGGVEFKCPERETQMKTFLSEEIENKYLHQMKWQMLVTDRPWWDYFSFCPELPEPFKGWQRRIEASPHELSVYKKTALDFINEFEANLRRFNLTI